MYRVFDDTIELYNNFLFLQSRCPGVPLFEIIAPLDKIKSPRWLIFQMHISMKNNRRVLRSSFPARHLK